MRTILNLLRKEFTVGIRDKKANIMMVLFPIVLMVILGSALSGIFNGDVDLDEMKVIYTINGTGNLKEAFEGFIEHGEEMRILFTETTDVEEGKKSIKDIEYSAYVLVDESNNAIRLYKNERFNLEANLVEAVLNTFIQKYNVIFAIVEENPQLIPQSGESITSNVNVNSIDEESKPSSMDYYAVTMLTLILMYASLTGHWSIKTERQLKTGSRVLVAPVKKYQILIGKLGGSILITILQMLVVIIVSKYILKANWGEDIITIIAVLLSQVVMAVSLGTGIAFVIKSESASMGLLNIIIPLFVFLGGGYMPLDVMGGTLVKLSNLSPVKWMNQAIFRIIYNNDYSLVLTAVIINLAFAALFITASSVLYKKEAA